MEVEEKTIVRGGLKGWQGVGGDIETHFFRLLPSEELRNFGCFFPETAALPERKFFMNTYPEALLLIMAANRVQWASVNGNSGKSS